MSKTLKLTALKDRPTLGMKKGDVVRLTLDGDLLVKAMHEQAMGLIVIDDPDAEGQEQARDT